MDGMNVESLDGPDVTWRAGNGGWHPKEEQKEDEFYSCPADSIMDTLNRNLQWDLRQQQLYRQNAPPGERVTFVAPSYFQPEGKPMLMALPDVVSILVRIEELKRQFPDVDFEPTSIAVRKAFLARVDTQAREKMEKAQKKCQMWFRLKVEYQSLVEYDIQMLKLLAEKKVYIALL